MTLTPLFAILALAFQSPASPKAHQGPTPVQKSITRIALLHITALEACEYIADEKVVGLDFITSDPTTNLLIIRADAPAIKEVRQILTTIDTTVTIVRKIKVLKVDVKALFDRLAKPIRGVVFISYDPTDNSIVTRATPVGIARLSKLIADLDAIRP